MQVRGLNRDGGPTFEEEFRRYYEIYATAESFERPWAALQPAADLRVDLLRDDPGERVVPLVAVEDGEVVGAGAVYLPLADNRNFAWLMPWVEPAPRQQGIGSALVEEMLAICQAESRPDVLIEACVSFERRDDHPYLAFAKKLGFALATTDVRRQLDLPVDGAFLDALIAESAPHHHGYGFAEFDGSIPDALLPSLCETRNRLSVDAPSGDVRFEKEQETPELYRHREATFRAQGRVRLTTVAIAADGDVVAFTDLVLPQAPSPEVWQWGTLVRAEHRGHRLGVAIKARALKELQARVGPDRTRIDTQNSEQNPWMVSINERLGFRPLEVVHVLQRHI
jgi:GNAT superfamily N-acetyltransferase